MTGGPAVTELLKSRADYVEQPTAIRGYITGAVGPSKSLVTAPSAFTTVGSEENWLWVAAPEYSTSRPLGPCQWDAIHGSTLPAQYAACVVLIDSEQQPTVVWWEGNQGEVGIKPSVPPIAPEGEVKVGTAGAARRELANLKGNGVKPEWKIKHGLKTVYVSVSIHLEAATEELKAVLIKEIKTTSENELALVFETPPAAGKVYWVMMTA